MNLEGVYYQVPASARQAYDNEMVRLETEFKRLNEEAHLRCVARGGAAHDPVAHDPQYWRERGEALSAYSRGAHLAEKSLIDAQFHR